MVVTSRKAGLIQLSRNISLSFGMSDQYAGMYWSHLFKAQALNCYLPSVNTNTDCIHVSYKMPRSKETFRSISRKINETYIQFQ